MNPPVTPPAEKGGTPPGKEIAREYPLLGVVESFRGCMPWALREMKERYIVKPHRPASSVPPEGT